MKGIPLSDKEYNDTMAMLDSFKPCNMHKQSKRKKDRQLTQCIKYDTMRYPLAQD